MLLLLLSSNIKAHRPNLSLPAESHVLVGARRLLVLLLLYSGSFPVELSWGAFVIVLLDKHALQHLLGELGFEFHLQIGRHAMDRRLWLPQSLLMRTQHTHCVCRFARPLHVHCLAAAHEVALFIRSSSSIRFSHNRSNSKGHPEVTHQ